MNLPTEWKDEQYASSNDTLKSLWEELIASTCYVKYLVTEKSEWTKQAEELANHTKASYVIAICGPFCPRNFYVTLCVQVQNICI